MAYPVNLADILHLMGHKDGVDFTIEDRLDGNGPVFAEWNGAGSAPTESQVNTFYTNWLSAADGRLALLKTQARSYIDNASEKARLRYVTAGAVQSMVYLEKKQEALAYKTAGYPAVSGPDEYPHLTGEATGTGKTEQQVADEIITTSNVWLAKSAEIEGLRMGGKKQVDDASTEADITTAKDTAVEALKTV